MKAIMVMFDSLNRRMLPPYGCEWVHTPNFDRLARRTVTFDNCYAGSMPCMPARRELHTGRHNFLHRSWGPLEPFDDSMPEILKNNGVHTHLATDHQHYWEDGGATYHGRYSTFEFVRGQEGDPWKGEVAAPGAGDGTGQLKHGLRRQDRINRGHMADEADHPQTRTFDAGLEFIAANAAEDRWFLQIESFDPHEPFFSPQRYKDLYPHDYDGPPFDWPDYKRVTEEPDQVEHARREYAALLSMCDRSLGRVLDLMDRLELWDDTLLIVCTDHGFLLGEHGWWGKNIQPWYDETIHTPLFVWDPRAGVAGERRAGLVQTIDFAPTLLDFFGIEPTVDMYGAALSGAVADDTAVRDAGLFGVFGGHVCVTDGRHVYMRASADPGNRPLHEHTLMPTHMRGFFAPAELADAELADPFSFTKGLRTLRVPGGTVISPWSFGTLLFDLETDPGQERPLRDPELELRMADLLVELMRASDAPADQYERLGLPTEGPVTAEHLLIDAQWRQVTAASAPLPPAAEFPRPAEGPSVHAPLRALLDDPRTESLLRDRAPRMFDFPGLVDMAGGLSPFQLAAMTTGIFDADTLRALAADIAALAPPR